MSAVPSQWKLGAMRLFSKAAAMNDPSLPSHFRPIALTSCVGKLFTTILRNRWLSFMITNGYFNKSIEKAFMPTTPGCTEHHMKLATILQDARAKHKSLAVCWLDLANAYGSVHHSLISFTLRYYNAPPQFSKIVQMFYTGLYAKVSSSKWSTPLKLGAYQGDPLSVVIFNTVINTAVYKPDRMWVIGFPPHRTQSIYSNILMTLVWWLILPLHVNTCLTSWPSG